MTTSDTPGSRLVALLASRPSVGAAPGVWAAWFEAKAEVFDAVAAETTSPVLAREAASLAVEARRWAAEYRAATRADSRGVGSPDGAA